MGRGPEGGKLAWSESGVIGKWHGWKVAWSEIVGRFFFSFSFFLTRWKWKRIEERKDKGWLIFFSWWSGRKEWGGRKRDEEGREVYFFDFILFYLQKEAGLICGSVFFYYCKKLARVILDYFFSFSSFYFKFFSV